VDRREFFRFGIFGVRDSARKKVPDIVKNELGSTLLDISILTSNPGKTEELAVELLTEHFDDELVRLKQSRLEGSYPGGVLLFENNRLRDFHDGISKLFSALRMMETELHVFDMQTDPTLLRFVNKQPLMSRSVEIFKGGSIVLAAPLSDEHIYHIDGNLGAVEFEVKDGRFFVREASCPHGTCLAHPPIITPGQRITCVPNNVSAVIGTQLG